MDTAVALVAAIGSVVFGLAQVWIRTLEIPDRRALAARRDLEMLHALPSDSTSRDRLREHIDEAIEVMLRERRRVRHWPNVGLGVSTFVYGLLLIAIASQGGWWQLFLAPGILFPPIGLFGAIDGLRRGERDEGGFIISERVAKRRDKASADESSSADPDKTGDEPVT